MREEVYGYNRRKAKVMCGIAGIWNFQQSIDENKERQLENLRKMLSRLDKRGPDYQGVYKSRSENIVLGHRRLKIIDTSDNANQPMISQCKRYVIVFNGEIYNFKEIRSRLESKGIRFRTNSDTEVLLEAYTLYKYDTWRMIDGMFALAIYDRKKKELIIARDRFGEKPLYWFLEGNAFSFASELKSLLAGIQNISTKDIDKASLAQYFLYRYIPSPQTIIRGVRKLKPGSYLIVNNDLECYEGIWATNELEPWEGKVTQKGFEQACTMTETALLQSLERRLISDVPLGLFMSAGLDSSLVAVLCSRVFNKSLDTFTYGSKNNPHSEHEVAIKLSSSLGHNPHCVQAGGEQVVKSAESCGACLDEPLGDRGIVSQRIISQFAKEKITVCLSGDGADELFGGYDRYQKLDFRETHMDSKFENMFPFEYFTRLLRVYPYLNLCKAFPEEQLQINDSIRRFLPLCLDPSLQNGFNAMRAIDLMSYLPDCVLTKVDRSTMERSLESRSPFLCQSIANISSKLPQEFCVNKKNGQQKLILRKI